MSRKHPSPSPSQAVRSRSLWRLLGPGALAVAVAAVAVIYAVRPSGGAGLPPEIDIAQAHERLLQDEAVFLNVRSQEEWDALHIPNTTLIPLDQLPSRLGELPRERDIVVVCRSGNRSRQGRDVLTRAGFTRVTSMAGGVSAWRAAGYSLEAGSP